MTTRVLFVDDEPRILDGLRRQLRRLRDDWDMEFRSSGAEALELMGESPVDVVVSDMRMPGMDGAELLRRVSERHPETIRIALSGHADKAAILKAVASAHQYLSKPCDADELRSTIHRACALRSLLASDAIRSLVSTTATLPSLPGLYVQVKAALASEHASRSEIGKLIESDLGMSAQVLKVANSAFFGARRSVADVPGALAYLGVETVQSLVLTAGIFRQFEGRERDMASLAKIWAHSLRTAQLASALARGEGFERRRVDETFASAMLHDIGKLVLLSGAPEAFQEIEEIQESERCPARVAERRVLGTTHGEVGGYLMGLWGLPDVILEGVTYHVAPDAFPGASVDHVTLVHVADCFARTRWEPGADPSDYGLDVTYLERLGVLARLDEWGRACAQPEEAAHA